MTTPKAIIIRSAKPGDESEVANVHLNSWREAYKGLLPQDYLDQLPLTFKRRQSVWQKIIADPDKYILQVAESPDGIVGFATFEAGRDPGMENLAEVSSIYLLEKYKGQGIGYALLKSGFKLMQKRGFTKAYCWVLENNPTIKFYERSGAVFNGKLKEAEIAGQQVKELAYLWDTLDINDYN